MHNRTFSETRRSNDGGRLAGFNDETDLVEYISHLRRCGRVPERDLIEGYLVFEFEVGDWSVAIAYPRLTIDNIENHAASQFRCLDALDMWQGGNQAQEARNKCNEDSKHVLGSIGLPCTWNDELVFNED